jgi:hypothetical protein
MSRLSWPALAVTLLCLALPASAAAARPLRLGINGDVNSDVPRRLGLTHVRQSLHWAPVQPHAGAWNWESVDFRVTAAARRGLTLLPVLLGGAPWVGPWNQLPASPDAYAAYVARLAARYGPRGDFWRAHRDLPYRPLTYIDLWNEPYLDAFSRGGVDPGRYARLVRAAAQAGRAANPRVRYLLEADWTAAEPRRSFIDRMYAAVPDLNRWFDAVSVHPYSGDRAPDRPGDADGFSRIGRIRERLVAHGAARKPLWITEIGWSTCPAGEECVSERAQASYYRRVHRLTRRRRYVRALYFYNARDARPAPGSDREAWFGVTRSDGSPKPAFRVLRQLGRRARP